MTERQLLRLIHIIMLAKRRAKVVECRGLDTALDNAAYYAARVLGERMASEREISLTKGQGK